GMVTDVCPSTTTTTTVTTTTTTTTETSTTTTSSSTTTTAPPPYCGDTAFPTCGGVCNHVGEEGYNCVPLRATFASDGTCQPSGGFQGCVCVPRLDDCGGNNCSNAKTGHCPTGQFCDVGGVCAQGVCQSAGAACTSQ